MTQETKHTAGPWFTSRPHSTTYIEARIDGGMIQEVASIGPTQNGWGESQANAHLIAAAPDLLAALIYLRDCTETGKYPGMGIVHAAIRKAGGKP